MERRRLRLSPDYHAAILAYLLELERTIPRAVDYLSSQTELQSWMREKLVKWVVEVCGELKTSAHTVQLTLTILAIFLSKVKTPKAVLQLVGVSCVLITAKFEEGINYTLEHAYNHSAKLYQKKDIITTELYCLEKLEWRLYYPTAAQLLRHLIYVTGVDYDFSKIIAKADAHCLLCYIDYRLSLFSPIAIGIVCTVVALEQFKQLHFRNQWLQFLYLKVPLKVEELDDCWATLLRKLDSETSESEKVQLKHISRKSFATLLAEAHSMTVLRPAPSSST
jgi:hypothetical protein